MLVLGAAVALAAVTGCAIGGWGYGTPYPVQPGWDLVLGREISVPDGVTALWFQNGSYTRHIDRFWDPYCRLRLAGNPGRPRTITPDRFPVRSVHPEWITGRRAGPLRVAQGKAAGLSDIGAGGRGGDDPLYVAREIVIGLESAAQPDVRELACGQRQSGAPVGYLTRADLDAALGEFMRFLPGRPFDQTPRND